MLLRTENKRKTKKNQMMRMSEKGKKIDDLELYCRCQSRTDLVCLPFLTNLSPKKKNNSKFLLVLRPI